MTPAGEIVRPVRQTSRREMEATDELRALAVRLRESEAQGEVSQIEEPLAALEQAVEAIARSWSGSNMGYQSRVYYADFEVPPPGAHFDPEWGFLGEFHGTTGDWQEHRTEDVIRRIHRAANVDQIDNAVSAADEVRKSLHATRPEIISVFTAFLSTTDDALIRQLGQEAEEVKDLTVRQAEIGLVGPQGSRMIRDTTAFNQGFLAAPHQQVLARVISVRSAFGACASLAAIAERGASHIERLTASQQARAQQRAPVAAGDRVFIGHGRSLMWHRLKDFVSERLGLPHDEFNRVPVAGFTNIARLSEMLDNASIAFIVLTAEDETADGTERARQNVVHEAGLFQGRLGFSRAIVMLEEGCEEFSNIAGLGQIRFPRGNISAAFEEVRQVLEREGLVAP